jgi:hypothetical protein
VVGETVTRRIIAIAFLAFPPVLAFAAVVLLAYVRERMYREGR